MFRYNVRYIFTTGQGFFAREEMAADEWSMSAEGGQRHEKGGLIYPEKNNHKVKAITLLTVEFIF
ncbi:hypothetical protein DLD99_23195 [Pseudomonas kribbensis]|uniref:Uncharacterized protein n=1 Tax=Pseudomonas kribbensis TaxID=1628086 RepID=A0A345RVE6_9PSED|nr:hypothetical protein DLD99_23195 [Pseudomonas kribbensis]